MKKNVLFVSTGSLAFGESVMALNFARSLPKSDYNSCFILSPLNSVLLEQDNEEFENVKLFEGAHKINRLLVIDFLEKNPPDIIVLCDFLTFDFSQADFGINLKFLRAYGKPIISLDTYEWESGNFTLDFFSGVDKQLPRMLLQLDGALRPCPLNKPAPTTERIVCYSFLDQIKCLQPDEIERKREELGINPNDFVIFSATAVWQAFRPKTKYKGPFGHIVSELLSYYVSKLNKPVHWIRVGPERERTTEKYGNITEHNFPSLQESEFDKLLAASDILVTSNVASTTLVKCIKYGRSALLLYNSIKANQPSDLAQYKHIKLSEYMSKLIENAYPLQPFLMFPLGWYKFLSPIMKDNPYLETFYRAEILDEEVVLSILHQAIQDKELSLSKEVGNYEKLLKTLPSPSESIEHFINQHNRQVRMETKDENSEHTLNR
ncbi:MAG: hypothetical protein JNN15_10235 [Blastocatellia bacterium]|nr:hypothetical protein [Blastocatellia bacterium]